MTVDPKIKVELQFKKRFFNCILLKRSFGFSGQQESGFSSMKSECGQNGNWSAESAPHSTQATPQKPEMTYGGHEFYSLSADPATDLNQVPF